MQLELIDTARWTSWYRYQESQKALPLLFDPIAIELLQPEEISSLKSLRYSESLSWAFLARTLVIDNLIEDLVRTKQVDTIINLGSGYDARAWRLNLPSELIWLDVDHQDIGLYKQEFCKKLKAKCNWSFYSVDYQEEKQFQSLQKLLTQYNNKKTLLITEGLLYYLTGEQLNLFYQIIDNSQLHFWITDYINGILKSALNILAFKQRPLFKSSIKPKHIKLQNLNLSNDMSLLEYAAHKNLLSTQMQGLHKYLNFYPKFIADYYRYQSGVCCFRGKHTTAAHS
jgi:methyltransferase (TIGR00027 family)